VSDDPLTQTARGMGRKERLEYLQKVQKWALESESARRINAMLDLARSEPGIPILPGDLDRDPWLFNCENGTLELRTGTLREHRREDYITKLCPTPYDPGAGCPTFLAFLADVFAGQADLIAYVRRQLGHALSGDTSEHLLHVWWGGGANGKSTLLGAVLHALGADYALTAPPDLLLTRRGERHPTELAALFGKRLVVCQETGAGRRLNEALVKWLTGGDRITARRMRENFWEFDPTHKAILVTNHRPEVRGTDGGIWRRIRLVPFTVTFPEERQDKRLPEKLRAEAPGILAWMVAGFRDWQEGGMRPPRAVLDATRAYRCDEDILGEFLAECCELGAHFTCAAGELYARFRSWCEGAGEREVPSQKRFGAALGERGFGRTHTMKGALYQGLRLPLGGDG
jgi:putative DNA primase/helicase